MRIKHLDLRAFGPFTDHVLDFSSEYPGLHIVYGPNEAGKSSCLRALHSFFFGIPARTSDNFIHPYDQLLIGGCLQGKGGRERTFLRRKKRVSDLFDENDDPIDPAFLASFLGGMEAEMFESLYGIDHEALVRGGQDILDQKGDVGQAIFAAGAGLTSLHRVLEELEKEGDGLFRPRASTKAINEALSQYRDLQSQMKEALLSSREWQGHRRSLQAAEQDLEQTRALRREKDREKSRIERLRRALPHLSQRRMLMEKLKDFGEVVVLPADFMEQRRHLEQERNDVTNRLNAAISRINEIRKRKDGVTLQQELLNRADEIEGMYQRLGEYRKAMADRPRLEGMRISCKTGAATLLKQVRPDLTLDQAETVRPGLSRRKTIHNLGNRYEALVQKIEQYDRETRKHETSLVKIREDLSNLPSAGDPRDLIQTLKPAQKAGDLDDELKERRRVLRTVQDSCRDQLSRLGLWNGPLDQVARLAVPIQETLNRFEGELDSIHDSTKQIQKEKEKLQTEFHQLLTRVQEIRYAGEVPAEEDLIQIRSRRDSGWQLLKRQWIGGEDVAEEVAIFSPEDPLPDAYEKLVASSDQKADRLRREADRVQKQASLKAQIQAIENRRSELDIEAKRFESELADTDRRWHDLWAPCGIIPLAPREMRQWVSGFEKLRFRLTEAERSAADIEEREKYRHELKEKLIDELRKRGHQQEFKGPELTPVLLYADALLDSIKSDQGKRERLESKIDDLQDALRTAGDEKKRAEEKLGRWQAKWTEALVSLGLDTNAHPDEANDFMDTLQSCLDKLDEAEEFRKRIDGIDQDNQNYEKDLTHLLAQIALEIPEAGVVQTVSDLQAGLNGVRQDQAIFLQYVDEIKDLEQEILQAQMALNSNKGRMVALLGLAGCEKEEDLDEVEHRSSESVQLKGKLSDAETTLAQIAEGVSFSELEGQLLGVDPDALPGQIQALSHEIEEGLDPEIHRLTETVGREKNEMAKMDGSARAAELSEASQQTLASIRRLTERFIRVKLSSKILMDVIENYRAENQDPILKLASNYFKEITLDSFAGLRTDIDDQRKSILIGVRPDGAWVRVEGMSSGTRDQLYLALRLATLEWRLASGEAMPFIVDDILINFDDNRTRSTLKALRKLAEKNQIILFTHHLRIVEIAKTMDSDQRIFIHEI